MATGLVPMETVLAHSRVNSQTDRRTDGQTPPQSSSFEIAYGLQVKEVANGRQGWRWRRRRRGAVKSKRKKDRERGASCVSLCVSMTTYFQHSL